MGINKNFVVRQGIEVADNLIYADGDVNKVGIGTTNPQYTLDVAGQTNLRDILDVDGATSIHDNLYVDQNVTALEYYGDGVNLVGIVTEIVSGIGIDIFATQNPGKGVVEIQSYKPVGKTIYVAQNGDDNNTGLTENYPKRTIKSAAASALYGDTIRVFPGVYVEENPIVLGRTVSLHGTELRNCVVTPKYPNLDLFYVNNGCHVTNLSFIGQNATNGAAIVALQSLTGVSSDRFFDAARMIRYNLDFIASEAVGFLTSVDYPSGPFTLNSNDYSSCKDDIKDIFKAICHDITRGGNSKCVGAGLSYYTDNTLQHIVGVKTETIDTIRYAAGIAKSCINNVNFKNINDGNYQDQFTQVRDLSIQADSITGSNTDINSCINVLSSIDSCVGVVTTIIDQGPSVVGTLFNKTYPGNSGIGFTTVIPVNTAVYDEKTGKVTIDAPGLSVLEGDIIEIRDLLFECSSGPVTSSQLFPSGKYGYEFYVDKVNLDGTFDLNVGVSTIPHDYLSDGYIIDRSVGVTTAIYDNITGIATITAPGAYVRTGDVVTLRDLIFECPSGAPVSTQAFPSGKNGYDFQVTNVIGVGNTFVVNVGSSTIAHTYVSGGIVRPPFSKGVGPIVQGPYVRNCTNFIANSIGMKVDGFNAEPGDQDDIGVTGTMSVDSYTQYNQGGIGVSITNGGYAQLVSIFTICDDIAIYTGTGGQCDLTNSNASFGNYGLYSDGVGDETSKSIYRYTGTVEQTVDVNSNKPDTLIISGVGTYRPYDGQALYFGELFYRVDRIHVTNSGSGYNPLNPPNVIIDEPPIDALGIRAEGSVNIDPTNGSITSIDVISTGSQYRTTPNIIIDPPSGPGTTATADAEMYPIYYYIESATEPSAGISTVVVTQFLNNTVSAGTTVYFSRLSLQIATTISFEWVGAGTNINTAKPALGGITIPDNEIVKRNGGQVVFTSTNQAGNFRIGSDLTINQLTGTISGRAFSQSLLNTVTPLIIAIGK